MTTDPNNQPTTPDYATSLRQRADESPDPLHAEIMRRGAAEIERLREDAYVIGAMYADAELSRGALASAAEDVLKAVVPHPKFQHKTRLIWAAEIENLVGVLENLRPPQPHAARDGMLNRRGLPTPEQAKQMSRWLRGMMQLSAPEQKELRERLEALGAGEGKTT